MDESRDVEESPRKGQPPNDRPGRLCQINRKMLRFKLHFFSYIGAMGITVPYVSIISTSSVGLSVSSLGTILTFQQILYLIINPMIGYVTDYFNKLKGMICMLTVLFGTSAFLLLTVPRIQSSEGYPLKICELLQLNSFSTNVNTNRIDYTDGSTETNLLNTNETSQPGIVELTCAMLHQDLNSSEFLYFMNETLNCLCDTTNLLKGNEYWKGHSLLESHRTFVIRTSLSNAVINCTDSGERFAVSCRLATPESTSEFQTYQFWAVGILLTVLFTCVNALLTLGDTACQESVRKSGSDYGRQRLFGSFGFAIMTVVGGSLYDLTGSYVVSFTVMGLLLAIKIFNVLGMQMDKPTFSKGMLKEFQMAVQSRDFLLFLAGVLLNGAGASVTRYYLLVFLTQLGSTRTLTGLVVGLQNLIEIPFMFFSGWVIRKIGHYGVLVTSLLAYCLRFLAYSYLKDPWWALAIELFQGATSGLFHPAATSFAKMKARPGTEATTQAVVFTTYDGFGLALGSFLFGVSYNSLGGQMAFFYGSILFGCSGILLLIFSIICVPSPRKGTDEKCYSQCEQGEKENTLPM